MIWLSVQDQQRLKNNDGMKWHATQTAKGMLPLSQGHMAENVEVKNQLSIYIHIYIAMSINESVHITCHLPPVICHLPPLCSHGWRDYFHGDGRRGRVQLAPTEPS